MKIPSLTSWLPMRKSKMKTDDTMRLDHRQRWWLLVAVSWVLAPKVAFLPLWASGLSMAFLLWNGYLLWKKTHEWPRWPWRMGALMLMTLILVALQFRTSVGRDAAVTVAVVLTSLKLMEIYNLRDSRALLLLCYFQSFVSMLYDQSIPSALWLGLSLWLTTTTAIVVHQPKLSYAQCIKSATALLAQGVPLALALFVLFPRSATPLWGVPRAETPRTGLSESMAPGSISDLVRSSAVAFQASFTDKLPSRSDLYWRGVVLTTLDGDTWKLGYPRFAPSAQIAPIGQSISYQVVLTPHDKPWLFSLDYPVAPATDALIGRDFQMAAKKPVATLLKYSIQSRFRLPNDYDEDPFVIRENLQLPRTGNQRTRELAAQFRRENSDDVALVHAILQHYNDNKFSYTLSPPLMREQPVDQFLFDARSGFCEHYAGSFVYLMRAAGVPARVVAGYQGGEFNSVNQTLVVRQYDAHAWAEVWIAREHRWMRVDPTAAVSPLRIEEGLSASVSEGLSAPVYLQTSVEWIKGMRDYWQALNYRWDLWVLGYSQDQQQSLLKFLGFEEGDWRTLGILLMSVCASIIAISGSIFLWRDRRTVDHIGRRWQRLSRRLGKQGLERKIWEGPLSYLRRVALAQPQLRDKLEKIGHGYIALRYGPPTNDEAVRQWKKLIDSF